ncbi:peptidoglycan-binding protein [Streptomyces sp. BH-SS-21]|uniref:Peptidoglycan-binding protein n=1 Tax=Streptomyces liliiviolaceus TaxID=2823109 RepID=A0A940XWH4_9ACTN|nr:peptidoglycan-binding protein [Streptomyces liliiviolaceus]MBQ0850943.1 peptidoglycan-binding protein [Streptomyces liliiviolaceus]
MSRYKPLSDELDPCARQLVEQLRRLKDQGELTMRHLAAKTGYSARSWERYLGGTSLPPREALEALARITGADPVPLIALHEIAADTWDNRRAQPDVEPEPAPHEQEQEPEAEQEPVTLIGPTTPPAAAPAPGRFPHIALTAGVIALAVALSAALLLMLRLDDGVTQAAVAAPPSTAAASPSPSYTCRIARVDGRWSAGINEGRNDEIVYGATGADVAEAQCLLRRAGISPGGIDGMFGPLTLRAVKTFQQRSGLVVDGMLGPRSWKALRG